LAAQSRKSQAKSTASLPKAGASLWFYGNKNVSGEPL
jgi:hypothetical protein